VDTPDLSSSPWNLTSSGIGGKPRIADVGGVKNLFYYENRGFFYKFEDIAKTTGIPNGFIMGPGAGSARIVKVNSELAANTNIGSNKIASKYAIVTETGGYTGGDYKSNEAGILGNFLVSEGKPGKAIHVKASVRTFTGHASVTSFVKKQLTEMFPDKTVGIAGIFNINKGKIKAHVMPDFPACDLLNDKQVDDWLKFYEMNAPLTCVTVFLNNDLPKFGLRLEHTHFWSSHGDIGHYHYDVTPDDVEYEGYFIPCEEVFKISTPQHAMERTEFFHD